jgi:hypothetical protein
LFGGAGNVVPANQRSERLDEILRRLLFQPTQRSAFLPGLTAGAFSCPGAFAFRRPLDGVWVLGLWGIPGDRKKPPGAKCRAPGGIVVRGKVRGPSRLLHNSVLVSET